MPRLTIEQYMQLSAAGYSAEEIAVYNTEPNVISQPGADQAPAQPENTNISAPASAENTDEPSEAQALVNEMRQLVAIMRNANIRSITMPTETPPDAAQIAASILAPAKANK